MAEAPPSVRRDRQPTPAAGRRTVSRRSSSGSRRRARRWRPEGGVEPEAVQVPGWRAGAGGAERRREGVALDLGGPAAVAVACGGLLQGRRVGHPGRLARKGQVDALQLDRDRAGRVPRQVAGLAGPGAAGEVEVAVEPQGADPCRVGPAVGLRRPEEERDAGLGRAGREQVVWPAPRQLGGSVAVEVGHLGGLAIGHVLPLCVRLGRGGSGRRRLVGSLVGASADPRGRSRDRSPVHGHDPVGDLGQVGTDDVGRLHQRVQDLAQAGDEGRGAAGAGCAG